MKEETKLIPEEALKAFTKKEQDVLLAIKKRMDEARLAHETGRWSHGSSSSTFSPGNQEALREADDELDRAILRAMGEDDSHTAHDTFLGNSSGWARFCTLRAKAFRDAEEIWGKGGERSR